MWGENHFYSGERTPIMTCVAQGVSGGPPMMLRDSSLSDSFTSDRCGFSRPAGFLYLFLALVYYPAIATLCCTSLDSMADMLKMFHIIGTGCCINSMADIFEINCQIFAVKM